MSCLFSVVLMLNYGVMGYAKADADKATHRQDIFLQVGRYTEVVARNSLAGNLLQYSIPCSSHSSLELCCPSETYSLQILALEGLIYIPRSSILV